MTPMVSQQPAVPARGIRGLIGAVVALCLGVTIAATALAADDGYTLGVGDRLRITVYEQPELSGEYAIGPSATLSIPLVGRMRVDGLTLERFEAMLIERLARQGGIKEPRLSVDILEYRPFFILGAVEDPGKYPYVVDMTVLHAITIAGGFRRVASPDLLAQLEVARVRERYASVGEAQAIALARRARLIAERDDLPEIVFPPAIRQVTSDAKIQELMTNESRLRAQRAESLRAEIQLLEAQKGIITEEITALEKQSQSKGRLMEINAQEMAEIDKLRQRDLVPITRVLALRRSATELESDRTQLLASIARAKQEMSKVDVSILNLAKARSIQITESIKQAEDELSQLAISRASALDQLRRAEALRGRTASEPLVDEVGGELVIVRRTAAGVQHIRADDETRVLPGDLIKVPGRVDSLPTGEANREDVRGASATR